MRALGESFSSFLATLHFTRQEVFISMTLFVKTSFHENYVRTTANIDTYIRQRQKPTLETNKHDGTTPSKGSFKNTAD